MKTITETKTYSRPRKPGPPKLWERAPARCCPGGTSPAHHGVHEPPSPDLRGGRARALGSFWDFDGDRRLDLSTTNTFLNARPKRAHPGPVTAASQRERLAAAGRRFPAADAGRDRPLPRSIASRGSPAGPGPLQPTPASEAGGMMAIKAARGICTRPAEDREVSRAAFYQNGADDWAEGEPRLRPDEVGAGQRADEHRVLDRARRPSVLEDVPVGAAVQRSH